MGTAEMIEQLFGFWHMDGNCYLWANRLNPKDPPVELWPLHPNMIKVVAGKLDIQGYVYGWGTPGVQDFEPDELMHLKFTSYDDKPHYGLSPIEVAMRTVDQMNAGNDWNVALMQNDARPSGLFASKGYLTTEQRNQIKKELRSKYSGKANAGKPLVLEADMSYQNMAIPPKELDWLASRSFNWREIAAILDVPPILVGDQQGQTYANLKEAKQSLFTENVLPKLYRMVDHTNIWLIPMFPDLCDRKGNPVAYLSYDKRDIEVLAELYTSVEQAFAERALNLYNNGGCSLRYLQEVQGMEPKKSIYLDVYKLGPTTLVREEDLEAYAQACLEKAGAPTPAPTPFMPHPGQPQLPASTTTVTEEPPETDNPDSAPDDGKHLLPSQTRQEVKILNLSTKEEKSAYMAKLEEQRSTWESEVEQRMQTYFKSEQKAMSKALEACSTQQQVEGAIDKTISSQEDTLKQVVYDIWYDVAKDFSESTIKRLQEAEKVYNPHYQTKGFFSIFTSKIISWLLNLSSTKVKQINDTTRTQLRQSLADGVEAGESIPQIAKRIDQLYLQDIIPNRSTVIARSEVVSSSNWASQTSAEGSGLALNKVWLATEDDRTRPAHAEADGQRVGMNEPFEVGGEKLMYPGDPDGSASNTISCRCTQYYERVKDGKNNADELGDEKVVVLPRNFKNMKQFMRAVAI
jgi:HK97 family phage portal protein